MNAKRQLLIILAMLLFISLACGLPTNNENTPATEAPVAEATATEAGESNTPIPISPTTETPAEVPTNTAIAPAPTETPINQPGCVNDSDFLADVNIPDGKLLKPGSVFTKTWRIVNSGECTWTANYTWDQIGGDQIQATQVSLPLSGNVAPGEELEISVELTLSNSATEGERYSAQFQLHDPDGIAFGTHPFVLIYTSPGAAVCPVAYIDYSTYISASQGFCLLFPETYVMSTDLGTPSDIGVYFRAPYPPDAPEGVGILVTSFGVKVESAGGLTSQQFADQTVAGMAVPGNPPTVDTVDLDGETAYFSNDLDGMFGNRVLMVVHNGNSYLMTLSPIDPVAPEYTATSEEFWTLVLANFTWIN